MSGRRTFLIIASIIVSAAMLFVVMRDIPLGDVVETMQAADPGYLLLSFICITASLFMRGIRWWELLSRRLPLSRASHLVNIMFLGNQLPLRLGEVARGVLATRDGVPLVTSATSIVVERLIDTLVVVLMIAAVIRELPNVPPEIGDRTMFFGLLAWAAFIVLLILAWTPRFAQSLVDRSLNLVPLLRRLPLKSFVNHLLDGLQPLTRWRTLAFTLLWNAAAWILSLAAYYCLHLALGIQVDYALSVPLGISLAAFSLALPVSVAGLGPFELAIVGAGQIVGMDNLAAVSLGFLLHGMTVISYVIWGAIGLLALGIGPRSLVSGQNAEDAADA